MEVNVNPQLKKIEDSIPYAEASKIEPPPTEPANEASDPVASLLDETPRLATPDVNPLLSSSTTEPLMAEKSQ